MIGDLPVAAAGVVFVLASAAIVVAGPRMVAVADRLADVTGLGEAFVGAVFVGATTSLPDLLATVTPAVSGFADQAVGNALGGVLAQTAFLAVADLTYRRANLEHAAASLPNLFQAVLLVALLGVVLILFDAPVVTVGHVHVGTLLLPVVYWFGLRLVTEAGESPMWRPTRTTETRPDVREETSASGHELRGLVVRFLLLSVVLAGAGWALGRSGEAIVFGTPLSQSAVGVLLTGVSSSLSELVISVSAVRSGALTLAVANVIGGNTFDTMLVGVADVAYRPGPVYGDADPGLGSHAALAILMTAVLMMGLLRRERHGVGNIGTESALVLVLYAFGVVLLL